MNTDLTDAQWLKSSYSSNGGACVEVAASFAASHGTVPVRDSKDPGRPALRVPVPVFVSFVAGVKGGRLGGVGSG
ncbi:DUF397 domain-containing protein [Streptomyces sp. JNUCC 64]